MNHKVTLGLPIYNGENFLKETMDSLLGQTFSDFELLVSDNGSTDATEEIVRSYMAMDDRIQYFRLEKNLGASENHNRLVPMGSGEYFKWVAHDDIIAPTFLERCVDVLDEDPEVVLAYSRVKAIDPQGNVLFEYDAKPKLNSAVPHERLYECIIVPHAQSPVFGLMRREMLLNTKLLQPFSSSDRVLVGEITLHGRVFEIPEFLFFYRLHEEQSWQAYTNRFTREVWFYPDRENKLTLPHWRLLQEHFISVLRSPLNPVGKIACMPTILWWIRRHWRYLANNLVLSEPGKRAWLARSRPH